MSKFVKSLMCLLLIPYEAFAIESSSQTESNAASLTYWLPEELNQPKSLEHFQTVVSSNAHGLENTNDAIKIALIYPSADLSDFWSRNYHALTSRLNDLRIAYTIDEFSSRQIDHALQTYYTDQVLAKEEAYDYVIFGPSELSVQADNIQRLASSEAFKTYIWAFHTPMKNWTHQPDAWFDFSSAKGAAALCDFVIKQLGNDVFYAMNRGIPGITDDQRSGDFKACVTERGNWLNLYEHFGQYQATGGRDGVELVIQSFPEVTMLHNANTAMTLGALEYLQEQGLQQQLYVTGWGGTAAEIELIKSGDLSATPMRMGDDVGVATAEAIKFDLLGKSDQVPQIYLGRIEVVDKSMSNEQIDKLTAEAFRYSGVKNE